MPKHKPVHTIFNNRWKPVIDFIAEVFCSIFDACFMFGSFSDSVEKMVTRDNKRKSRKKK